MLNLQGFIEITPLIKNPTGEVSPIGELSEQSKSFAKDKQFFGKAGIQTRLVAFTSERDKVPVVVPAEFSDHILAISQWVYTQAIQGNISSDESAFLRFLMGSNTTTMSQVSCGGMLASNGNWFPRWIKWRYEATPSALQDATDVENEITMWFSDNDFNLYYPGYEIIVVPPTETIDTFMSVKSVVEQMLSTFNLPDHHEKAAKLANGYPYTKIVSHNYTWHDREDFNSTTNTTWSVIVYGRAGLNTSRIKEAYREFILGHSEYKNVDWAKVFPEIFTSTKFTFVPAWNIRGIPNQEDIAALYHPAIPYDFYERAVEVFGSWLPSSEGRPQPETDSCVFPTLYKSLAGVMIAGPENEERYNTIHAVLKDYALIASLNPDVGRFSGPTYEWLGLFFQALIAAEDYHSYSVGTDVVCVNDETVPGRFFWTFEHNNIEYRVLGRKSLWVEETPA